MSDDTPRIAEAVGTASAGSGLGPAVQAAMAGAVNAASLETEEIWARTDIDEDKKRELIAAIMAPDEIRRRMMAAREAVHAAARPAAPSKE